MFIINLLIITSFFYTSLCYDFNSKSVYSKINSNFNLTNISTKNYFKNCGQTIKSKNGFITSPNFPNKFETPIYCKWLIDLSSFTAKNPNQNLIINLNEVYVKQGLKFTEYSFYLDENLNVDKKDLPIVDFNFNRTFLISNKNYIVLQFQIHDKVNNNLNARVTNSLFDYHGFNITFELVKNLDNFNQSAQNYCSFKKCNFNGRCLIKKSSNHECECFDKFHGNFCEYGPDCDPFKNINSCLNGGNCIYSSGLKRTECKCPNNYYGYLCENYQHDNQFNVTENDVYIVKLKLFDNDLRTYEENEVKKLSSEIKLILDSILKRYNMNLSLQKVILDNNILEIHIFYEYNNENYIKTVFTNELNKGSLRRFNIDKSFLTVTAKSAFTIVELKLDSSNKYLENENIQLSCLIKNSTYQSKVIWLKDGNLIQTSFSFNKFDVNTIQIKFNFLKSTLSIFNTSITDSGSYTCFVSDGNYELKKSVNFQIKKIQKIILNPMSKTLKSGSNLTIDCYIENNYLFNDNQNLIGFNWLKDDKIFNQLNSNEYVQELYPIGSRLIITNIQKPVKYKCISSSLIGSSYKEIFVDIIDNFVSSEETCKPESKENIYWEETKINSFSIQKCKDDSKGFLKRKCLILRKSKAVWSKIDYSDCLNNDLYKLFLKFDYYFKGIHNSTLVNIIEETKNILKNFRFKTGEGEFVLKELNKFNKEFLNKEQYYKKEEFEKILFNQILIANNILDKKDSLYNQEIFSLLQKYIFDLAEKLYLNKYNKNKNLHFKYFDIFLIESNEPTEDSFKIPLNSSSIQKHYALFNVDKFETKNKLMVISFKINDFIIPKNVDLFLNSATKLPGVKYLALKKIDLDNSNSFSINVDIPLELDQNILKCGLIEFHNGIYIMKEFYKNEFCSFQIINFSEEPILIGYNFFPILNNKINEKTILEGLNKLGLNIINTICCLIILITIGLNIKDWKMNSCLVGVLKLQLCISLVLNHIATSMALTTLNQINENYWLILFTLSQISALTIQFCICVAVDNNFETSKLYFAKNISIKISIISTIVPFSLIGLICEFYYTNHKKMLWTLEIGSTLFCFIIIISSFVTIANLYFYLRLKSKLKIFERESSLLLNSNKFNNISKLLTQTIILTILLNIYLALILIITNIPIYLQSFFVLTYGFCSFIIVFIVLKSFRTKLDKIKSSIRNSVQNLSLNRQRKVLKHLNNSNNNSLFNCNINSIYS